MISVTDILFSIASFSYIHIGFLFEQSTHVALAFEVPGGWHKEKDAIVLTVLQVPHFINILL